MEEQVQSENISKINGREKFPRAHCSLIFSLTHLILVISQLRELGT